MSLTIIKGKAGTGKTHEIINLVKSNPNTTVVVAPTNKAVDVLKKRGIKAYTIHSALFNATPTGRKKKVVRPLIDQVTKKPLKNSDGEVQYTNTEEDEYEYSFNETALHKKKIVSEDVPISTIQLIIDEASMISADVWYQLMNEFSGNIVAVGDDRQLKPVEAKLEELRKTIKTSKSAADVLIAQQKLSKIEKYENFFVNSKADVELKTVHRQTSDSKILVVADSVLKTGMIPFPYNVDDVVTENWDALNYNFYTPGCIEALAAMDIVLCFRNKVCAIVNAHIRAYKFREVFESLPELDQRIPRASDKLYVESKFVVSPNNILNKGTTLTIASVVTADVKNNVLFIDAVSESGDQYNNLPISLEFVTGKPPIGKVNKSTVACIIPAAKVSYGYAITCHKAQGSQWECVAVIDESIEHVTKEWRYTAVTRASGALFAAKWISVSKLISK